MEVRDYEMTLEELLDSEALPYLLGQAALTDDMAHTKVHECSWVELEKFIEQDVEASLNSSNTHYAYMRPVNLTEDEANIITL